MQKHTISKSALSNCVDGITDVGMNVTMSEVSQIAKDLPTGKSSGLDSLNGESMKHARPLLCLLVSICFTSMFKHCYISNSMINSVINPIIKNKSGDLHETKYLGVIINSSMKTSSDVVRQTRKFMHKPICY